jgi:DNA-binding NtrC family response regulator
MNEKSHILLVDDEAPLREALAEQLTLQGDFIIHHAENALTAIKMTQGTHFDINSDADRANI